MVDVVAIRRRAAPAIGKSAVDSAGNSTCSGSTGQKNRLEAHDLGLMIREEDYVMMSRRVSIAPGAEVLYARTKCLLELIYTAFWAIALTR